MKICIIPQNLIFYIVEYMLRPIGTYSYIVALVKMHGLPTMDHLWTTEFQNQEQRAYRYLHSLVQGTARVPGRTELKQVTPQSAGVRASTVVELITVLAEGTE